MITRRQGREWAVQFLVEADLNPPEDLDAALTAFWEQLADVERVALDDGVREARVVLTDTKPGAVAHLVEMRAFAEARIRGVTAARDALDAALEPFLANWPLYRLGTVERAVLRLAAWEILNCADIPAPIVVNEAVDLAKFFSETKSGRFVNAVVDKFAKTQARRRAETVEEFAP